MAQKLLHSTKLRQGCKVNIYRDSDYGIFVVKSIVGRRVHGDYETNDKQDARNTAAQEAKWLKKTMRCR